MFIILRTEKSIKTVVIKNQWEKEQTNKQDIKEHELWNGERTARWTTILGGAVILLWNAVLAAFVYFVTVLLKNSDTHYHMQLFTLYARRVSPAYLFTGLCVVICLQTQYITVTYGELSHDNGNLSNIIVSYKICHFTNTFRITKLTSDVNNQAIFYDNTTLST